MTSRRRIGLAVLATALLGVPVDAAPRRRVLFERSGVVQRAMLHVTQDAFRLVNNCTSTTLQGTDVNGVSAAVLDVSKYAGQHLAVALTDELAPFGSWNYVLFFTRDCRLVDFDTHDGTGPNQWNSQVLAASLDGTIPARAAWLMIGHGGTSADFGRSTVNAGFPYGQLTWKVTVTAVPKPAGPKGRPVCRLAQDAKGDGSADPPVPADDQFDIVSADLAVDATAVTVGIRLARYDLNDVPAVQRWYVVEFTVPGGRTLFLAASQEAPSAGRVVDDMPELVWKVGTKDASGYHPDEDIHPGNGVRGWVDNPSAEIRISAQLARPKYGKSIGDVAPFKKGTRLTAVTARAFDGSIYGTPPPHERDRATTSTPYVVGTPSCLTRVD